MSTYSQNRNESRILQAVNMMIVSGDIKNPRLSTFASISHITLSKDNAYCTLYVTCLDEGHLRSSVQALQGASAYIQGRLGIILRTKNTPKLTFVADNVETEARRIDNLLSSLKPLNPSEDGNNN